jgi:hypothetical protein
MWLFMNAYEFQQVTAPSCWHKYSAVIAEEFEKSITTEKFIVGLDWTVFS